MEIGIKWTNLEIIKWEGHELESYTYVCKPVPLPQTSSVKMEDDAAVIYGLEFQARALTAQTAETDAIRFFVGTQSLRFENQVEYFAFVRFCTRIHTQKYRALWAIIR